jgi:hypothetical protein
MYISLIWVQKKVKLLRSSYSTSSILYSMDIMTHRQLLVVPNSVISNEKPLVCERVEEVAKCSNGM